MEKLKPCPFCGSKAESDTDFYTKRAKVYCVSDTCDAVPCVVDPNLKMAIEKWNCRDPFSIQFPLKQLDVMLAYATLGEMQSSGEPVEVVVAALQCVIRTARELTKEELTEVRDELARLREVSIDAAIAKMRASGVTEEHIALIRRNAEEWAASMKKPLAPFAREVM